MTSEEIIQLKLINELKINNITVLNKSHLHKNHSHSPETGNSHFQIVIRDKEFALMNKIKAHQLVYKILQKEMSEFIHGIEINITSD